MHDLQVENCVLFGGLAEDLSPIALRDCSLGLSPQPVYQIKHNSQLLGCTSFIPKDTHNSDAFQVRISDGINPFFFPSSHLKGAQTSFIITTAPGQIEKLLYPTLACSEDLVNAL